MYQNENSFSETVDLKIVLDEFERYKQEVYEEWVSDDSTTMPRELYEITHLGFNKVNMSIATIQFTEKRYKNAKRY
jgi:hypothetical protein